MLGAVRGNYRVFIAALAVAADHVVSCACRENPSSEDRFEVEFNKANGEPEPQIPISRDACGERFQESCDLFSTICGRYLNTGVLLDG